MRNVSALLLGVVILLGACRKKPDPVPPTGTDHPVASNDGHLELVFENMVGSVPLQLSTDTTTYKYLNEAGNPFNVSAYKYYVTNIKLWKADSSYFTEPESYHLVNEQEAGSKMIVLHDVPKGDYTMISFLIGVDYDRNTSGAQTGALDPVLAMFWDWNTGYIMAKVEGISQGITGGFSYHIGGFSGKDGVLRWVNMTFPEAAKVTGAGTPEIHIQSDVLEWFKTPTTIAFDTMNVVAAAGVPAAQIADNYADMFTVSHVEN